MFVVTTAEFTAEGNANILVNHFIPLCRCPSILLSDNGPQFCARLATAVYKFLGIHKLTTSAYHPSGNGGVERVNHTMAQVLAMICNEHQNDWDVHLPHVKYAYNNSVSAATGLAPNEVHIVRLPRLSLTIFDRSYGVAHQNLDRDQLAYCDLACERQQRAYELVREQHVLTVARVNGRNSALSDALLRRPKYTAGGWIWVYNTASTIRQGLRKGADNEVLKEKFSLNWTGPFKIIAVGPSSAADTPDGRPLRNKLLYLDLPSNISGSAAKPRVTVARCKPCANPYDADDIPRHLPAGLTQYVLHVFTTKSPPYHVTTPLILIDVAKITGHQCVRGRGGAIAVLYETHWNGILRPTWERKASRHFILTYWANGPDHHQPNTRQYQQLRINAAALEIARAKGERHLPGSYRLVSNRTRFLSAHLPIGASIWYHFFDGFWWLGKINQPLQCPRTLRCTVPRQPRPCPDRPPRIRLYYGARPLVTLSASKHTDALTRFKASYMVNHPAFHAPLRGRTNTADLLPETKTPIMSSPKTSTSETRTPMSTPKTSTSETKTPISTPETSTSETKTPISTSKTIISTPATIMSTGKILYLQ